MHILIGLLLIAVGTVVTWKGDWLYQNFGSIAFFDKYLGTSGGSRLGYKLFGVLAVFIGIIALTNIYVGVLTAIAHLFIFTPTQQ